MIRYIVLNTLLSLLPLNVPLGRETGGQLFHSKWDKIQKYDTVYRVYECYQIFSDCIFIYFLEKIYSRSNVSLLVPVKDMIVGLLMKEFEIEKVIIFFTFFIKESKIQLF